ncbi:aspartate dehydrogenase [Litoreibacter janthinus]|uniref:L-aspartate dehydrogenase n=1 Tax=Litoreibacter janthinus TaxID=670154 RepID=A0A1I6GEG0_9RHOB|nr:aspartate dehydrogenase [Litoreibacter janthinus]SFR40574.1 aspartate dehydrogenase [Litoreibacter janthinus]
MSIAILGDGAIASYVRAHLGGEISAILTRPARQAGLQAQTGLTCVSAVSDLPKRTTLLIDCAGHAGLAEHGPSTLSRGIDVLTVSIGALADKSLAEALTQAAAQGGATVHLATGAIGALDTLRAAKVGALRNVTYTGRKPPAGWQGSPAEEVVDLANPGAEAVTHFKGTAREAALRYPKNANVAAAVALAGLGFDATQVELIADPNVTGNTHEITALGEFGQMHFTVTGNSLPDNPRSSSLAAMSVVAALRNRKAAIRFA